MEEINFQAIEKKWQDKWDKAKIFEAEEDPKKKKFYVLEMFPYPSATGLHMGHAFNFTIGDVFSRFKKMQGFNVIHPPGFDSLGLPAENAAIKAGKHPEEYTNNSIKNFIKQEKTLGLTYSWERQVNTADPEYYKWDQWIFLKMFEKGLVYEKEAPVNWCSNCNTIISNEQAQGGKCDRCGTNIEIKQMKQWFLRITDYADRLLEGHKKLNWPEKTIAMQKNWIGKSYGTEIDFEIPAEANFVLLHGYTGNPEANFFPWLKKELESRGHKVTVPKLPNTASPKINEQIEYVLKNCKFDENTVLLGHSLGSVVALKVLEQLRHPIKKLILAAGFLTPVFEDKERPFAKTFDWKFNFNKIKNNVKDILILRSSNDSAVGKQHADKLKEQIGGEIIDFTSEEDHICGNKESVVLDSCLEKWSIFTTRPDTIFGVTFMVISAQHKRLKELVTKEQKLDVDKFLKKLKSVSEKEMADMEKEGVFTGSYAINPATNEKVPVYAGNFVVADYGAGMVMAVPAHDTRDFKFAKKYKIPIKQVVAPYFLDINNPPKQGKENTRRDIVHVIVLNKSGDKFIALKNKKLDWVTPITGGIEQGEDALVAAEREVKEESGYQNFLLDRQMPYKMLAEFYASHKDVNRSVTSNVLVFRLKDEKQLPLSKEESEKHEVIWLPISELKSLHPVGELNEILEWFSDDNGSFTESGKLINSKEFDGISSEDAKKKITDWLISKKLARQVVNYKLRDWSVARQRYWGTPIPLIHCEKCGVVAVPEKELPVKLPKEVKFGEGNPLLTNAKWLNVLCPKCKGKAKREANTMDTFVNSSWYFLRYCDPKNNKEIFSKEKVKYWMPVDLYIGGAEHACMHLIYSRFYAMFLHDLGLIDFEEATPRLFHQGMINDAKGEKMSKSKGNVIEPLETMAKYGVDATRFYLLSEASPEKGFNWTDSGIQGATRIINKVWKIGQDVKIGKDSKEIKIKLNNTIKGLTSQIESLDYRKSTIEIRELFDAISKESEISKETLEGSLKLLAPFCPHIAEELWEKLGHKEFISLAEWPKYEEIKEKKSQEDLNEKIILELKQLLEKFPDKKKAYIYVLPFELAKMNKNQISKELGKDIEVFAVNDPKKFDPENKSKKALPGKPGIYLE